MALTVGTDSYVTLAECETYLAEHYLSSDLTAWDATTDADKEVLLRRAAQTIDRQPLQGFKSVSTQTMQFPRMMYSDFYYTTESTLRRDENWYIQTEVPEAVKDAQCEIALSALSGTPERVSMAREGVRSYRLGNLSETLSADAVKAIVSHEARELLAPYVGGGYQIR